SERQIVLCWGTPTENNLSFFIYIKWYTFGMKYWYPFQLKKTIYSFMATCKKHDVNHFEWLKKVLEIIPDHKANRLHELLPQNLEL
ncbi:MAG: transposase domain-containing protein, partial [Bacteroidales bacterium]|nr:transposase domain-containing protein [Bacteroidales bacterium]